MVEYTGEKGKEYYDMRRPRRSAITQMRRASHFQPFIKETDTVLDFGCGTGGILKRLTCAKKIGIEVNPPSVKEAEEEGIVVYSDFSKLEDNSVDIVISSHALEHVQDPAAKIREMERVLKKDGQAILIVPSENPSSRRFSTWVESDPDRHVHSWTPLSFGNLVAQCGLTVQESARRPIGYSHYIEPLAYFNQGLFQIARRIVAYVLDRYEIACTARKK